MKPTLSNFEIIVERYSIIGLMSGTSLDGLDIALCEFEYSAGQWLFEIAHAKTVEYDGDRKLLLRNAHLLSGQDLAQLHVDLGKFFAEQVQLFRKEYPTSIDAISSHGHTVFHQPNSGLTFQIGSGAILSALTKTTVVCDFRTTDVALGGQGAPLVPIGDKWLFSEYDFCLNLGGIANISFEVGEARIAFDICPANMVLDTLAQQLGLSYDKGGEAARSGELNQALLNRLNDLPFYRMTPPKSLGREWFEATFLPLLKATHLPFVDLLHTVTEHIAMQIAKVTEGWVGKLLVTGGGAWNDYLMERVRHHSKMDIVIPDPAIVNFKEALIFAFLGVLRLRESSNTLTSVTGASRESSGGCIYFGKKPQS